MSLFDNDLFLIFVFDGF